MRAVLCALGLAAALAAGCDGDTFENPPSPDLFKVPYDFGLPGKDGGADQGMPDLAEADLSAQPRPDLTPPPDLTATDGM